MGESILINMDSSVYKNRQGEMTYRITITAQPCENIRFEPYGILVLSVMLLYGVSCL